MRISRSTNLRQGKCVCGKPVICVTIGYPAGIGPEVVLKALASPGIRRLASFLIIGDLSVFKNISVLAKRQIRYKFIESVRGIDFSKESVLFLDMAKLLPKDFKFGKVSKLYGRASIEYISKAVSLIKQKKADILVTAPIHKHAAELSGFKYPGHTEYLARLTGTKRYAMMLTGDGLRVVLVTTHMAIKDVPKSLRKSHILDIIKVTDRYLRRHFSLISPRIAVCGLNPHAGDAGILGTEEISIITPAVRAARSRGIDVYGPYAADALFYDVHKGSYDAVICMYHDQGLVALKMIARDKAVNITLGLPFIRTSPGHGTALDIAGKGIASPDSMKHAIKTAVEMYNISSSSLRGTKCRSNLKKNV